jgi:hypothetical protein
MAKTKRLQLGNDMVVDGVVEEEQEGCGKRSALLRSDQDDAYTFLASSGLTSLAQQQNQTQEDFW